MPRQPDLGARSGRDMGWPRGLRGSAPGRRLGPAGHRDCQPLCRESWGSWQSSVAVGPLGPLREVTLSLRPRSTAALAHAPGVTHPRGCWCRRAQGSWQGMGSAPGTEESRPLLTHPTRDVSGRRGCPQLAGASCRTMAVGLNWALPYPVLHFPRCSAEVPAGCHPPSTKPAELSSCGNGGSPAHCPSWFAAG